MMGISEYGLLLEITGLDEIPAAAAPFFASTSLTLFGAFRIYCVTIPHSVCPALLVSGWFCFRYHAGDSFCKSGNIPSRTSTVVILATHTQYILVHNS